MKDYKIFIRHILDEIDIINKYSRGLSYSVFIEDELIKRAFLRSLEIIGEAVKKIPEDVKIKIPDIEWKKIAGLRDVLIHHYFGVDYETVWDVDTE